jgi:hypothetical protein
MKRDMQMTRGLGDGESGAVRAFTPGLGARRSAEAGPQVQGGPQWRPTSHSHTSVRVPTYHPQRRGTMAAPKAVVKLLKPDGAGHMRRLFERYSVPLPGPATTSDEPSGHLLLDGFRSMLQDLAGDDSAGVDARALFEVRGIGCAGEAHSRAETGPHAAAAPRENNRTRPNDAMDGGPWSAAERRYAGCPCRCRAQVMFAVGSDCHLAPASPMY